MNMKKIYIKEFSRTCRTALHTGKVKTKFCHRRRADLIRFKEIIHQQKNRYIALLEGKIKHRLEKNPSTPRNENKKQLENRNESSPKLTFTRNDKEIRGTS